VDPTGTAPRRAAAGVPPDLAIGCLLLDHGYRLQRFGVIADAAPEAPDDRERGLLMEFSRLVGASRPVLVSYNGRAFDLPVLALRSLCHAVPMAWYYRDKDVRYRYSGDGHLDLCDWLADHGAVRAGKLDQITKLIGLPGKLGIDGSDVEALVHGGQLAEVERYCLADVAQTALLFLRFRLLQGLLSADDYRDRATALLDALARDGRVAEVVGGVDRDRLLGAAPA
jgi:predicted PolB exonuclease-like 3'-5' exonuclease